MIDQEVRAGQIKIDRFPFPSQGDIELGVRNANYALGPVMLHLTMKPGAVIPAHLHKGMAEALYVVEGDFTNEGKQYLCRPASSPVWGRNRASSQRRPARTASIPTRRTASAASIFAGDRLMPP
ncbi:MAG TPA: hypothetical protein VGP63_17820, partial [Planctomycetaceae bacterium]|nr:hypothetical protein [Planctomycetaceae bacterium]